MSIVRSTQFRRPQTDEERKNITTRLQTISLPVVDLTTTTTTAAKRKRNASAAPPIVDYSTIDDRYPFEILLWDRFSILPGGENDSAADGDGSELSKYQAMVHNTCNRVYERIYPFLSDLDDIVIESQEISDQFSVKMLASALQAQFETLFLTNLCPILPSFSTGNVKLRVYEGPVVWAEPVRAPTRHQWNKRMGMHHIEAILAIKMQRSNGAHEWRRWHDKYYAEEKRDDMGDCLLQALWRLKKSHASSNAELARVKAPKYDAKIHCSARTNNNKHAAAAATMLNVTEEANVLVKYERVAGPQASTMTLRVTYDKSTGEMLHSEQVMNKGNYERVYTNATTKPSTLLSGNIED